MFNETFSIILLVIVNVIKSDAGLGYNYCDGLKSNKCIYEFRNFKTNSCVLALGLIFLINKTTKQEFNINFEYNDKYYGYYNINFLSPDKSWKTEKIKELYELDYSISEISNEVGSNKETINKVLKNELVFEENHLTKDKTEIKKIIQHDIQPDWVFDIETESGKFMAGVGKQVISNSPVRGETFVTRKITRSVAQTYHGLNNVLYLGNLDAERDWGHAKDYVEGMWLMLQQDTPDDYVLATNRKMSVRRFVELAYKEIGITIKWEGQGIDEVGLNSITNDILVKIDKEYFRPTEVDLLIGDYTKAKEKLGWEPKYRLEELINEMVSEDIKLFEKDKYLQNGGYEILSHYE